MTKNIKILLDNGLKAFREINNISDEITDYELLTNDINKYIKK